MMTFLSHTLTSVLPIYGREGRLELEKESSLEKGDSSDSYWVGLNNHWGTHVDCPAHFFKGGKRVSDYEASFWFFHHPQVLPLVLEAGELVSVKHLDGKVSKETDLLLLQSGWWKKRAEAHYSTHNPGIHPDVGLWLRKNFKALRAVGFDWISISSYQQREIGRAAHRSFLDPKGEHSPVLIFEDMDLSSDLSALKEVWAAPLRVEGMDSAPCTMVGRLA